MKVNSAYNLLYNITFVVTLLTGLKAYTLWPFFNSLSIVLWFLSIPSSFLLMILCIPKYKNLNLIITIVLLLIVLIIGHYSERLYYLWSSFVLIIGAKGIQFRKLVKLHFVLSLCFCLFNIIGYEMGMTMTPNVIDPQREGMLGDNVVRMDFGYGWATDFATHVFFILLDYWLIRNGNLRFIEYLLYLSICSFLTIFCDARLAVICIFFILCFSLYIKYYRAKLWGRLFARSLVWGIPIFALISVYATFKYDSSNLIWFGADVLLSGRLSLGNDAIYDYGFSLLGQPIEMYGQLNAGGAAVYNFVDCSYVQYYLRYGIVLVTIIIYLYYRIGKDALRRSDLCLLSALFIAGLSGVIAQFVFDLRFCILLVAITSLHSQVLAVKSRNFCAK